MSDVAISVENISKCYRIGTQGGPGYHRLSEMITGVPRALWDAGKSLVQQRSPASSAHPDVQNRGEFWALKDVSFEVKQGEVVGIIGRNGAGKSTLLKILSRITEPTSGRFGIRGRVASLLEVGTGFHPELTGRENIYVSGVTLGMTRAEIKKRFDEIVDFSGVEKFLDTPVKHYSSGMQVRLGFSVAAHLESEILIVDEVLAVGDTEFQRKSGKKLRETAAQSGRTVMLVTHSQIAFESLCGRGLLIENGEIVVDERPRRVLECYNASFVMTGHEIRWAQGYANPGITEFRFDSIRIYSEHMSETEIQAEYPFDVELIYTLATKCPPMRVGFVLQSPEGAILLETYDSDDPEMQKPRAVGTYMSRCRISGKLFSKGELSLSLVAGIPNVKNFAYLAPAIAIRLNSQPESGPFFQIKREGLLYPNVNWFHETLENNN